MSIEYLNIKEVPNDKAKDYFMRKIGKEFLLGETPSKEEFAAYTNSFSEKWALGAFEMSKYLIEASVSQVGEDLESKLEFFLLGIPTFRTSRWLLSFWRKSSPIQNPGRCRIRIIFSEILLQEQHPWVED